MRKIIAMTLFSVVFGGCSIFEKKDIIPTENIAIYFRKYVNEFKQEAQNRGIDLNKSLRPNISIYFVDDLGKAVGQCDGGNNIEIDRKKWSSAGYKERKRIIFHELGHCLLKRLGHTNGIFPNKMTKSIMEGNDSEKDYVKAEMYSCNYFTQPYIDYYMDELFEKKPLEPIWKTSKPVSCYESNSIYVYGNVFSSSQQITDLEIYLKTTDDNDTNNFIWKSTFDKPIAKNYFGFDIGDILDNGTYFIWIKSKNFTEKKILFKYLGQKVDLGDIEIIR